MTRTSRAQLFVVRLRFRGLQPDGKRLATASADHTAKVWNAENSKELLALRGLPEFRMSSATVAEGLTFES
jgi:WD40 repeat protein